MMSSQDRRGLFLCPGQRRGNNRGWLCAPVHHHNHRAGLAQPLQCMGPAGYSRAMDVAALAVSGWRYTRAARPRGHDNYMCRSGGGARISPEDYWRPCGRGACGSSVWTVVHAMTCRPHPSVYDRPTDRYTLAALALCGGPPCGSLPPSLNRYIPPPARGGKISKTPKKIRDMHKNTPPATK